ncbi:MAG: TolC family protein [Treponemataceae bacterium]
MGITRSIGCCFIVAAFLTLSFSAYASPRIVDENTAVELALRNDVGAAIQSLELAAKERKAGTKNNIFLPSFTGSAIGRESVSQAGDGLTAIPAAIVRLNSALTLSAATLQGGKTAELDAAASRFQSKATIEKVEKETRKGFFKLLLLREQTKVAESSVEIALGSLDRTVEEYRNGLTSQRTRRQSEIAYETEKLTLSRRRAEYDAARSAFSVRIGLRDEDWVAGGDLEVLPIDLKTVSFGSDTLLTRSDVSLAFASAALQESKVEEARRSWLIPTLAMSAQIDVTKTGNADLTPSGLFTLTFSSPNISAFLPFSSDSVSLEASRGTLQKLRLQADDTARAASLEVESILRTLSVSFSAITSLSASVELAREVVLLTREAYDVGAASYQDLRTAEKDADSARVALLAERYTYLAALIDLEYATGKPLRSQKEPS